MMQLDCNNKHIILVGNCVHALTEEQGKEIDSYDIVVRFGKGVPTNREKFLGSRTDIWATGSLRSKMRDQYPEDTQVLYNPSCFTHLEEYPQYEHTVMFTPDELDYIHNEYLKSYTPNSEQRKRLSIGVLTALYFCTKVNTFASLTFINFDFFHKGVTFRDEMHNKIGVATSWHLPLTVPQFEDKDDALRNHPAHDSEQEKKIVQSLLYNRNDIYFIGDIAPEHGYEDVPELAFDKYRKPIS